MIKNYFNKLFQKFLLFINDTRFKEILHGSFYSLLAKVFAMLLGIITSMMGARYYGADMIGLVAILASVMGIAGLFSLFGLSTAMLRFVPEYITKYSLDTGILVYKKIMTLALILTSVVSLILYFSSDLIAVKIFHKDELIFFISILSIILAFRTIYSLNMSMIRILKKIKLFAIFEFTPKLVSLILLLILTFLFYNKYNLVYISFSIPVIMALLTTIYLIFYLIQLRSQERPFFHHLPSYKKIFSVSFPMMIASGMSLIIGQTDIVMLGLFRSSEEVGIYSIVLSLSLITTFILNSINVIIAPKFSELFHAGEAEELKYIAQKATKLAFFSTLPILIFLLLFGRFFLSLYGSDFVFGYLALIFLVFSQFINAATGPVGYFLDMTGHQKKFRNIIIFSAILNILLNYILIPNYGIHGAAFASMLSVVLWNITAMFYIKKLYGFYIIYIPYFSKKIT
jgi:O-antigen/teichoic acid export membrane protein